MTTTIEVPLDPDLVEALRQITAEQGVSLKSVLSDLVRNYVREARREKIGAESERFQAMHAELKKKYLGQHVAVHEGQVVDHDSDPRALVRRIRQRFGRAPILVTQVEEKPVREFVIRSPRLVGPE